MEAAKGILEEAKPFNLRFLADNYTSKLKALIGHEAERNEFIRSGALMNTVYENDDSEDAINEIVRKMGGLVLNEERACYYWKELFHHLWIYL